MDKIKQLFNEADGVLILAGAGMSVDSGIPDFRGSSGIWTAEKDNFIKFASGNAWFDNPLEAWNFYIKRFMAYRDITPHEGYFKLKKVLDDMGADTFVMTSNVDEHFEKSGYPVEKIYTIHGDLKNIQCSKKCCSDLHPMPQFTRELTALDEAPHCPKCGSVMRPNVMMFNDPWVVMSEIQRQSEICLDWLLTKSNVVGIEIGAGLAVPSLRHYGAERTNALIRINPHDFQVNRPQDIAIQDSALNGIDTLIKLLTN